MLFFEASGLSAGGFLIMISYRTKEPKSPDSPHFESASHRSEHALDRMDNLVSLLWSEWKDLEQQIVAMNLEVEQIASSDPACQRLRQIPGIGPLVATAIVAAIGNGAAFRKGREFSSWLGLVPRQHSTGGKARLFGISKRGNCYLRKLLVHGARSAVLRVKRERSPFGPWLDALERRSPVKVVIIAAANKLARVAWAILSSGQEYRPPTALMPS
jgi:transposase